MKRIHPKWLLCALLALTGAFLFLCLPGYKFAGLFLLGLGALIPTYHFLKHDFLRRVLTALLALCFVVLSITGGVIARSAKGAENPGPITSSFWAVRSGEPFPPGCSGSGSTRRLII